MSKHRPWTKQTFKLPADHGFRARPGCKVFIANRGAVRFDYPRTWVFRPMDDGSIALTDREPPDDNCRLQVSVIERHGKIPGVPAVDRAAVALAADTAKLYEGLPVAKLLEEAFLNQPDDRRHVAWRAKRHAVQRDGLDAVWAEGTFHDPVCRRAALARACLARGGLVHAFITMDLWADEAAKFTPVWDDMLGTLRLGEYIADPLKHKLH